MSIDLEPVSRAPAITVLVVGDARRGCVLTEAIAALDPTLSATTRFACNDRPVETIVADARARAPSQGVVVVVERASEIEAQLAQGADEVLLEPVDRESLTRAVRHAALRAGVRDNHAIEAHTLERVLAGVSAAAESPLASLALDLDGLRCGSFESLDDFDTALDDCAKAVDQIGELLRDASVLARLDETDARVLVAVAGLLGQVLHALGDGAALQAHVELHADEGVPDVLAPPRRLARTLASVILQALDATPAEPAPSLRRLRIAVRAMPETVAVSFDVQACGDGAPAPGQFEVASEGRMAVTRAALRSFDGELLTQRGAGGATRLLVLLPRPHTVAPSPSARPIPRPQPQRRRARVLVIDRDPRVLRAISRALSDRYEVLVALGCEEALAVARDVEVDAVVLDPRLADLPLASLVEDLVAITPALARRFVLLGPPADGSSAQGAPVLKKPLRRQALLIAIESRLAPPHPTPSRSLN